MSAASTTTGNLRALGLPGLPGLFCLLCLGLLFLGQLCLGPSALVSAQPAAGAGGYLGVKVVENAATMEEIGEHTGVRVESVVENSPAHVAGVRPGDVIESLAGRAYSWPDRFLAAVGKLTPGREVELVILRDDVSIRLKVRPGRRIAPPPAAEVLHLTETERVGVKVKSLTREAARAAGLPPAEGVMLVGFWGKSPWKRDGLRRGDILHVMDGRPLHDPREFIRRIRLKDPGAAVDLVIVREGRRLEVRTVASRRVRRTEHVMVPAIYYYRSESPDESRWGVLLDIVQTHRKAGQRTTTILWVISWTTGEAEELEQLPVPAAEDAS